MTRPHPCMIMLQWPESTDMNIVACTNALGFIYEHAIGALVSFWQLRIKSLTDLGLIIMALRYIDVFRVASGSSLGFHLVLVVHK